MLGAFWNSVGGKIADRWATVSAGALVFWLGGLLAWALGHGGFSSLKEPADWLAHQPAPTELALVLAVLLGVAASGIVVQSLTTPAIRAMEGYWPGWLKPIRNLLLKRMAQRAEKDDKRWQELAERVLPPAQPTGPDVAAFVRLERRLHRRPAKPEQLMPTALGNTLRAAESHPVDKYGLDGVSVWPHLWLVVPDATRQELITARAALDSAARACVWGLLFLAFAPWTLLAVPTGLVVAASAVYWWAPAAARVFADLVEAAFDLHRTALYQHLRWPLPANPQDERAQGQLLTMYLWRGVDGSSPTFTNPP
jgi:hypothetical protein